MFIADYVGGQYRHAVFARYLEAVPGNFASPQIRWSSSLIRDNPGQYEGEQNFRQTDGASVATIRQRASMAMLDELAEGPLDLADIVARTSIAVTGKSGGLETADLQAMEADIILLWQHGLLTPLFAD